MNTSTLILINLLRLTLSNVAGELTIIGVIGEGHLLFFGKSFTQVMYIPVTPFISDAFPRKTFLHSETYSPSTPSDGAFLQKYFLAKSC